MVYFMDEKPKGLRHRDAMKGCDGYLMQALRKAPDSGTQNRRYHRAVFLNL